MTQLIVSRRPLAQPFAWSDFDRLFDSLWRGVTGPAREAAGSFAPRMDVTESENEIRVAAELPGLDEKDIAVSLEDGVLTVAGERSAAEEGEESGGFRHRETFRGSFRRALRLPCEVDADAVSAVYRNGILTVTLPKAPEARVRTIAVTGGSA